MSRYKLPFNEYKRIKKMSVDEMSMWIENFGRNMYQEGYEANNQFDPEENTIIVFTSDKELYDYLIQIKGMGPELTKRVVNALLDLEAQNDPIEDFN